MFYTYILVSEKNNGYYVGSTDNVESRLLRHNEGRCKYTSKYLPWRLVYTEEFQTRKEAARREKQIKSWKKRVAIEKLIANSKLGPVV